MCITDVAAKNLADAIVARALEDYSHPTLENVFYWPNNKYQIIRMLKKCKSYKPLSGEFKERIKRYKKIPLSPFYLMRKKWVNTEFMKKNRTIPKDNNPFNKHYYQILRFKQFKKNINRFDTETKVRRKSAIKCFLANNPIAINFFDRMGFDYNTRMDDIFKMLDNYKESKQEECLL